METGRCGLDMPLFLDIYGVIITWSGVNNALLDRCAYWRKQGVKIYGASNMSVFEHGRFMKDARFQAAFDEIFCSGHLGVSKPDPSFFAVLRDKTGELPENCLFIDDSGANVDAASRAGWQAAIYTDTADASARIDGFFDKQRRNNDPDETTPPLDQDLL